MNFLSGLGHVNWDLFHTSRNPQHIGFDATTFDEWRGIKAEEEVVDNWRKNPALPALDVAEWLARGINLDARIEDETLNERPLKWTFKTAVAFLVRVMNEEIAQGLRGRDAFPIGGTSGTVKELLIRSLSNIDTKNFEAIPLPPKLGGAFRSAKGYEREFWRGAIVQKLYEENHIRAFGDSGDGNLWFSL